MKFQEWFQKPTLNKKPGLPFLQHWHQKFDYIILYFILYTLYNMYIWLWYVNPKKIYVSNSTQYDNILVRMTKGAFINHVSIAGGGGVKYVHIFTDALLSKIINIGEEGGQKWSKICLHGLWMTLNMQSILNISI